MIGRQLVVSPGRLIRSAASTLSSLANRSMTSMLAEY